MMTGLQHDAAENRRSHKIDMSSAVHPYTCCGS